MTPAETTFARLYEGLYDDVHAFCARRVGWAEADDATADVFIAVWRRIDEPILTTHRAWLFGIARHVVLNRWRTRDRRRKLVDRVRGVRGDTPPEPDVVVVRRAEDDAVLEALNRLSARDQEILRLSTWEELSAPEIAHVLGIRTSAVHQRIGRARRRLEQVVRRSSPELVLDLTTEEGTA